MCLPEAWLTDASAVRRTACHLPHALCLQSKPQLAAALLQAIVPAGLLPFKSVVADCLYGKSPDFLDAVSAGVGVTTCVAIPSETRCWLQRPRTEDKIYTYQGDVRAKRVVVAPHNAPSAVAAVAASLPASPWYQRTVSEGTKGPMTEALARQRVTLGQDGLPDRAGWLVLKRTLGANPMYSYYISNAPTSTPWRTFVWLSGLRWAIEQGFETGQTERGMDHYEGRKYSGWHHHRLTTMLAHFLLSPEAACGKKAPALTVSPLRTILEVVFPLRTYTIESVLEFVAWVQKRNHQAYRAHRARRQEDG